MPASHSTLTGAELPQAKEVLRLGTQGPFGRVQLFATPWPVACQSSVREGLSRKEHWSVLASILATPFYSTVFPAAPAANSPESLVLPEPPWPQQLPRLHTWPSRGQTQVLQGSLGRKPLWTSHMQRWK